MSERNPELQKFVNNYAEALKNYPKRPPHDKNLDLVSMIAREIMLGRLHCPECGETQLTWKCGHQPRECDGHELRQPRRRKP